MKARNKSYTLILFLIITLLPATVRGQETLLQNTNNTGDSMPNIKQRALISGALFISTIISGYVLSSEGTPHNILLTTGHKLMGAANWGLLNYTVYQKNKAQSLTGGEIASTVFMNLCYVSTIVTGALLTSENPMPQWVHSVHGMASWLSIVSSAILLLVLNK